VIQLADFAPAMRDLAMRPALQTRVADLPWTPLVAGLSFKPLRFFADDRGYAALLRLEPGTVIPLHRHTGEIHAINLQGSRELASGELVGPGDYVFEPAGNVDAWAAVGDTHLVVMIVVTGAVEYLAPDGGVLMRSTAATLEAIYRAHCASLCAPAQDLTA
jgi:2,4'-dihydroxyacetophenone dioxygenase